MFFWPEKPGSPAGKHDFLAGEPSFPARKLGFLAEKPGFQARKPGLLAGIGLGTAEKIISAWTGYI